MSGRIRYFMIAAMAAVVLLPLLACSSNAKTPDIKPHLIAVPDEHPVRPIDGREEYVMSEFSDGLSDEQYRARVDELYSTVVFDGKKPVFKDGDPVEKIYSSARDVLDRYILNEWHTSNDGEFNIVHTVHDWLAVTVRYDFDLYEKFNDGETELASARAFFIDGVFIDGVAVCDGIARAFDFLCAIEGVKSMRVTGSYAFVPHAWNKVRVNGEWYNVDTTADAAYYTVGGSGYKKQLSHGYFMLSDDTIASFRPQYHSFNEPPYAATKDYDWFADKTLTVGGKEYSAVITGQKQLNALFKAISDTHTVGKLEIKLDFPEKTQVNAAEMYSEELSKAYGQIKNPDFRFENGSHPYFRYPNGVYLVLVYY